MPRRRFSPPEARTRAVDVSRQVIDGKLSILLAARELNGLLRDAGLSDEDEDLMDMVLIDSETDHLPLELPVRSLWNEQALEGKDSDIRRSEKWASEFGIDTCRRLIARFAPPNGGL